MITTHLRQIANMPPAKKRSADAGADVGSVTNKKPRRGRKAMQDVVVEPTDEYSVICHYPKY